MDLVRQLYAAINRSDLERVVALYHDDCNVEHVFTHDDGVYEGRDAVRAKWANEFERYAGALAGGHRFEVTRVAGIETGWGWVRADWQSAVRDRTHGSDVHLTGYSHFWIEEGSIRRHRSIARPSAPTKPADPADPAAAPASTGRTYPERPIVGVGAVILVGSDVVLVKRRYEPLAGQWSLPGGGLELGESLEAGVARETREETGLVVDVGPVVEVFDRILVDETGRVRYHFVLVDYLCHPRGGDLRAGTDVDDAILAPSGALAPYRVTEKARAVIAKALTLTGDRR
jgi:ADP-ribose pyrophosphatase YjhB (NUDIX family)